MIRAGYLAKRVVQRPDWLHAPAVNDLYSVSGCTSENFMDYIKFWRHNAFWLFDDPKLIQELCLENRIDVQSLTFFYYEVYGKAFNQERKQWLDFEPESFSTNITPPTRKEFHGYDVVSFSMETSPECSPLSCNYLASEIKTNSHCLLETFEIAKESLESGKFDQSEPGPFRIFAVYTVEPNPWLDESLRA